MPAGTTPEERAEIMQGLKYQKMLMDAQLSCPFKVVLAGVGGAYHYTFHNGLAHDQLHVTRRNHLG